LSFSIGHAVYDPADAMSADGFMKKLDDLMYQDKARNRKDRAREE
jgi:GGDEF domain-containing protein